MIEPAIFVNSALWSFPSTTCINIRPILLNQKQNQIYWKPGEVLEKGDPIVYKLSAWTKLSLIAFIIKEF